MFLAVRPFAAEAITRPGQEPDHRVSSISQLLPVAHRLCDQIDCAAREFVTGRHVARHGGETRAWRADSSVSSFPSPGPVPKEGDEKASHLSDFPPATKGSLASAISSSVVQLMREYTGRGPTKARTYMDEDLITVVLQDTLTMGERSLVRDGEIELVLASRKAFQRTMAAQLVATIEAHSGRSVFAFLSDNHIDPDIAVESFVLNPKADRDADAPENGVADQE